MNDAHTTIHTIDPDQPLLSPGTEANCLLTDIAKQAAMSVLVTMLREHDDNAEAPEAAVRALLLAAAELRLDITIDGRAALLSTMLLAELDELGEQLVAPPAPADEAGVRARLDAAARAGLRGDDAPPTAEGDGAPLVVRQGMAGFTRSLLAACTPPKCGVSTEGNGDAPPPLAG